MSLLTNSAAMTALQTLASTNKSLETTQNRISTGLRISEASDNAAYWSIATTMKSDNGAVSAVQDSLGLGAGKVDVAYSAINKIKDEVNKMKDLLSNAPSGLAEQKQVATQIKAIQEQIKSFANGANYAGSNLLVSDGAATSDLKVVSSYSRAADNTVTLGTIDVKASDIQVLAADGTGGMVGDLLAADFFAPGAAALTTTELATKLTAVETALSELTTGAATLGAAKNRIDSQKSFLSSLSDSIDRGVGQLVDADMNKESARLSALQVQQQLGVQALSIANSSNQQILSLFRG
ncbi:flagellin [Brucella sp. IR073]|uniref:flagellin N-terminal helical domain-containing protein n=1 Tax=unclassified Brucella TaxID=2632610 RepID=UPI003B97F6DC